MDHPSEKYKNKYRIAPARAPWWDYGRDAAYFITICTQNRIHYLGKIADGDMQLSEIGDIVETEWLRTVELRPDMNLTLGEFVVMPNHFHAIIIIGKNQYNDGGGGNDGNDGDDGNDDRDAMHRVCTTTPANKMAAEAKNGFAPQSKNLPSIIRGFKSAVTVNARKIHTGFEWQPRYHDHIIRDQQEYQRIENYIIQNPQKWAGDKFYGI